MSKPLKLYEKVTMDLNNGLTWIKVIFNVVVKKHTLGVILFINWLTEVMFGKFL